MLGRTAIWKRRGARMGRRETDTGAMAKRAVAFAHDPIPRGPMICTFHDCPASGALGAQCLWFDTLPRHSAAAKLGELKHLHLGMLPEEPPSYELFCPMQRDGYRGSTLQLESCRDGIKRSKSHGTRETQHPHQ